MPWPPCLPSSDRERVERIIALAGFEFVELLPEFVDRSLVPSALLAASSARAMAACAVTVTAAIAVSSRSWRTSSWRMMNAWRAKPSRSLR